MTALADFVEEDEPAPVYGPPCPGYLAHRWTLTVEDDSISLHSGCNECDMRIELHEVFFEIAGRLTFHHEHEGGRCPNAIRMLPCDCNFWYVLTPEPT